MDEIAKKVSICMITYNHEDYIEQAIISVLTQVVTFDFEFIIGNDASRDQTDAIIKNIIKTHPKGHLIRYFNHPNNLGISANFHFVLKACEGDYIAILEGDDFWIDDLKLQKQVDYLDAHPDYNLISNEIIEFHQQKQSYVEKKLIAASYTIDYKNLIEKSHTHTCTLLLRNNLPEELPSLFFKEIGSDRQLCLISLGIYGKGYISNEVVSAYRIHEQSISRIDGNNSTLKNLNYLMSHIRIAQDWNRYYGNKCNAIALKVKKKRIKQMLRLMMKRRHFRYFDILLNGLFYY